MESLHSAQNAELTGALPFSEASRPLPLRCLFLAANNDSSKLLLANVKAATEHSLEHPISFVPIDDRKIRTGESLVAEVSSVDLILAELSEGGPLVFSALGIAQVLAKPIITLRRKTGREKGRHLQFSDLHLEYQDLAADYAYLRRQLVAGLDHIAQNLSLFRSREILEDVDQPPVPDWRGLEEKREAYENFCYELLTLEGLRDVRWLDFLDEIDLVSEKFQTDELGIEKRDLCIISLGFRLSNPRYFVHDLEQVLPRLLSGGLIKAEIPTGRCPLTLMFLWSPGSPAQSSLKASLDQLEEHLGVLSRLFSLDFKFEVWGRDLVTQRARRHPALLHKYFGRSPLPVSSKRRKTHEELYREATEVNYLLHSLVRDLKQESIRRLGAESDSTWKNMAYTAAHQLGNAMFTIRNSLHALSSCVQKGDVSEVPSLIETMTVYAGKAEALLNNFKSIEAAQKLSLQPTCLTSVLQDLLRLVEASNMKASRFFPEHCPEVYADPIQVERCFAELLANARRWVLQDPPKIEVLVRLADLEDLTPRLDPSRRYVLVRFSDNGPGVKYEEKQRIFEPFVSHHPQGTGLGLAIVHRIVTGCGGDIVESGEYGTGARFDLFFEVAGSLPLV